MVATDLNFKILRSGLKLTYAEYGDLSGLPVFFFHGWPGSSAQGSVLAESASALGLRIIAVNRPGILGSDLIADRKLQDWGNIIADLADCLAINQFSVLGFSGGAPYALACAWAIPDRINQVAIVSGAPLLSLTSEKNQLNIIYRALIFLNQNCRILLILLLNAIKLMLPLGIHRFLYGLLAKKLPPRDAQALINHNFLESICRSIEDHLGSGANVLITDGNIYLQQPGFDLAEITKKVVFWHGRLDRNITLSAAKKMSAMVPDSELIITEDDGHYSLAFLGNYKILKSLKPAKHLKPSTVALHHVEQ